MQFQCTGGRFISSFSLTIAIFQTMNEWQRMHFMILYTSRLSKDGKSWDSKLIKLERKTNMNWGNQTYSQGNRGKPNRWCMVFKVTKKLNKSSNCSNCLFKLVNLVECILYLTLNSISALGSNQEVIIIHVIRVQGVCHVNRYKKTPLITTDILNWPLDVLWCMPHKVLDEEIVWERCGVCNLSMNHGKPLGF